VGAAAGDVRGVVPTPQQGACAPADPSACKSKHRALVRTDWSATTDGNMLQMAPKSKGGEKMDWSARADMLKEQLRKARETMKNSSSPVPAARGVPSPTPSPMPAPPAPTRQPATAAVAPAGSSTPALSSERVLEKIALLRQKFKVAAKPAVASVSAQLSESHARGALHVPMPLPPQQRLTLV
jgi:hypothetical protein